VELDSEDLRERFTNTDHRGGAGVVAAGGCSGAGVLIGRGVDIGTGAVAGGCVAGAIDG
jgi:hypothetical protein